MYVDQIYDYDKKELSDKVFGSKSFFYCQKCLGVMSEKTCPHGEEDHINFSGTKIREMLARGGIPPMELMRSEVAELVLNYENLYAV